MHLRCPHCQNPIEIADLPSAGEITCAGCGSSFSFDPNATTSEAPAVKKLGKFEIIQLLGEGAFGSVFKARDTELDRIVAIKVPRAGNVGSGPQDIDRFLREAAAFSPDGKSVVTACRDGTARLWPAFRPVPGDPERIVLWSEVRTHLTLDEHGEVRTLSFAAWHERRERLEKLGDPPLPD